MLPKAATYEDPHYRGCNNQGTRMAAHELLEIGHHLLRIVHSYVLGRRIDLVGSGLRQSRDSFSTWETRCALMNEGRRIR